MTGSKLRLYVGLVAGGVKSGSHDEVATTIAEEAVTKFLKASAKRDIPTLLADALRNAHGNVCSKRQSNDGLAGIGASITLVAIHENRLYLAHAGNNCAYLVREGKSYQLTLNHTWAYERVRLGRFKREEVEFDPRRENLARFAGMHGQFEPDLSLRIPPDQSTEEAVRNQGLRLQKDDVVVLCTDGLVGQRPDGRGHFVEEKEIVDIIARNTATYAAKTLVSKALSRGVTDNVSVVVMEDMGRKTLFDLFARDRSFLTAGASGLGVLLLAILLFLLLRLGGISGRPPVPTAPPGMIYAAQLQGIVQLLRPGQEPITLQNGSLETIGVGGSGVGLRVIGAGLARVSLADGSVLYLGPETNLGLDIIADPLQGGKETLLTIQQGRVLIVFDSTPGRTFAVKTPIGTQAIVTGSIMGVEYEPNSQRLDLDCLEGYCQLVGGSNPAILLLIQCQHGVVFSIGAPEGPDLSRNEFWQGIAGNVVPASTVCATLTPVPTLPPEVSATPTPKRVLPVPVATATQPESVIEQGGDQGQPLPPQCGDGTCNNGENNTTCPTDCGPPAAPVCGDGICNSGEMNATCASDCPIQPPPAPQPTSAPTLPPLPSPVCGDDVCDSGENHDNCPQDCSPKCGNGKCGHGENHENCPIDCPAGGLVSITPLLPPIFQIAPVVGLVIGAALIVLPAIPRRRGRRSSER